VQVWELKDIGLQAAHRVIQAADPLRLLTDISQNFPSLVSSISRQKARCVCCCSCVTSCQFFLLLVRLMVQLLFCVRMCRCLRVCVCLCVHACVREHVVVCACAYMPASEYVLVRKHASPQIDICLFQLSMSLLLEFMYLWEGCRQLANFWSLTREC